MSHNPQDYAAGDGGETVPSPVILQVLPRLVTGGAERGCVDVAAAIVRAGGRALVASAGGPMAHEVERAGGTHITLPLASKSPLVIRRNIGRLADLMTQHGVHLVHARSRAPAWSAWYACRRLDVPFVTTFHAPYNAQSILKQWYNSVMARGRRVIAISDYVAHHIIETYSIDPAVIRVIPRGIDFRSFAPERVSGERLIRLAHIRHHNAGVGRVDGPVLDNGWKRAHVIRLLVTAVEQIIEQVFRSGASFCGQCVQSIKCVHDTVSINWRNSYVQRYRYIKSSIGTSILLLKAARNLDVCSLLH